MLRTISFKVTYQERVLMRRAARALGVSMSEFIRQAVFKYIEQLECEAHGPVLSPRQEAEHQATTEAAIG